MFVNVYQLKQQLQTVWVATYFIPNINSIVESCSIITKVVKLRCILKIN